jgi:hypothetical protein
MDCIYNIGGFSKCKMEGGGFQDKFRARNEPECREAGEELYGFGNSSMKGRK